MTYTVMVIEPKIKKIILKMLTGRIAILIFFDLILISLFFSDILLAAKICLILLICTLNICSFAYFFKTYFTIAKSLNLPFIHATVKLKIDSITAFDTPVDWQSAFIELSTDMGTKTFKAEIGISSVASPNSNNSFIAKVYLINNQPCLILNEELGILATVSASNCELKFES